MEKTKFVFVLLILLTGITVMACIQDLPNLPGLLTINKSPEEALFSVSVFPINKEPTKEERPNILSGETIATGSGASPVKLTWKSEKTKAGSYFTVVVLMSSGEENSEENSRVIKFNSKGEATFEWKKSTISIGISSQ
jgi:hypothetical protein